MQIVIDIDNELYQMCKDLYGDADPVESAIANGIPLPKGHGRLIDADKTISKICGSSCGCHLEECGRDKPCFSVTRIESALTIIEADKAESEDKCKSCEYYRNPDYTRCHECKAESEEQA